VAAPDDDAALVALVEDLDRADDELRGRLSRELEARGALDAAGRLARSEDDRSRRAAARIAHLLPDERHVAALMPLVSDPEPGVSGAAWRALRGQRRTDEWRAAVEHLAEHGPPERRDDARRWLSET
jgi:HEAT repeat protein